MSAASAATSSAATPPPATTPTPMTLEAIQQRVRTLKTAVYNNAVKEEVKQLLTQLPSTPPSPDMPKAERAQLLLVRAETQLLLPVYSQEAETDLNGVLKLDHSHPEPFIALGECLWRKNAHHDAVTAAEGALGIAPDNVEALVLHSRLLRAIAYDTALPEEERAQHLEKSIAQAKRAVSQDGSSSDAWLSLGVGLIRQSVSQGLDLPTMKKALGALNMAASKEAISGGERKAEGGSDDNSGSSSTVMRKNPDIYYNRGVANETMGEYGAASLDYRAASQMDSVFAKDGNAMADACASIIAKARALQTSSNSKKKSPSSSANNGSSSSSSVTNGGGKNGSSSNNNNKGGGNKKNAGTAATTVDLAAVVDQSTAPAQPQVVPVHIGSLLSSADRMPLTYFVTDAENTGALLHIYRVQPDAFKKGDTLSIPFPPSSAVTHTFSLKVPKTSEETDPAALRIPVLVVEPDSLIVNGGLIPAKYRQMTHISTRLF